MHGAGDGRRSWTSEVGLVSLSAPIRDRTGALVAMMGISGPSTRLGPSCLISLAPLVVEAAAEAEHALSPVGSR